MVVDKIVLNLKDPRHRLSQQVSEQFKREGGLQLFVRKMPVVWTVTTVKLPS